MMHDIIVVHHVIPRHLPSSSVAFRRVSRREEGLPMPPERPSAPVKLSLPLVNDYHPEYLGFAY